MTDAQAGEFRSHSNDGRSGPDGHEPARRQLRFGVMGDGTCYPAWIADCIRSLCALDGVQLSALIVDARQARPVAPWRSRLRTLREVFLGRNGLWRLFYRFFVAPRTWAMQTVDLNAEFADVPRLEVETIRKGKVSNYFSAADRKAVREMDLDFVLLFGFGIVRGKVLDIPRFGIWSFHHDDPENYRGGPPCFWPIYRGEKTNGAMLQRITNRIDGGVVLRSANFPICDTSYVKNRDQTFVRSAQWPAEVCEQIMEGNTAAFDSPPLNSEAPMNTIPTNTQMLTFAIRLLKNTTKQ
ncbi:MAG: hypothetical protein AAF581_12975 [Planctomycetota bacterium]